jgi:hypothetical protein
MCSLSSPDRPSAHSSKSRTSSEKSAKRKDSQPEKQDLPTRRKFGHCSVLTILRLLQFAKNDCGSSSIHGGNTTSASQKLSRKSPVMESFGKFDKSTILTQNSR